MTEEKLKAKLTDYELSIHLIVSPKTKKEYLRVARQILVATKEHRFQCTSRGKWLQARAVAKKMKDERIVPKNYKFWGLPDKLPPRFGDRLSKIKETYISLEKFQKLLRTLPTTVKGRELHLASRIAYYSALRLKEVLSLTNVDIEITATSIIVYVRRSAGKGSKARESYLPRDMAEELQAFEKFRISYNYTAQMFRRYIENASFHSLRHSCASNWHNAGIPLKTIQMLLGHKSVTTTEIYTHVLPSKPKGLEKLGY